MLGRERDLDGHSSFFGDEEEVETDVYKKIVSSDVMILMRDTNDEERDAFSTGDVHAGNVVVVVVEYDSDVSGAFFTSNHVCLVNYPNNNDILSPADMSKFEYGGHEKFSGRFNKRQRQRRVYLRSVEAVAEDVYRPTHSSVVRRLREWDFTRVEPYINR